MFGVNHTLRKCCFVHRWLISLVAAYGKPELANHSQAFAAATWTLCYREGLDYYRIVVLFDCYQRQCIKTMTRSRRSKNIPQIVGRVITGRDVPVASISCTRRQKSALNTVSLR